MPIHTVRITKPFLFSQTEITQANWRAVMGTTPWRGQADVQEGDQFPASYINYDEAINFCRKLSELDGGKYRLPTEAEWEYAARAGTVTQFYFGNDESQAADFAWFKDNSELKNEKYAHGVGLKQPNIFGLFDISGNVWEWCSDWHDDTYYSNAPKDDPIGPSKGSVRVSRGGGFTSGYPSLWLEMRARTHPPEFRRADLGLRVVLNVDITALDRIPTASLSPGGSNEDVPRKMVAPFDSAEAKAGQQRWAKYLGVEIEIDNRHGSKMVLIPPGEFAMGSHETPEQSVTFTTQTSPLKRPKPEDYASEHPQHIVHITSPFYLGAHEVSRREFRLFVDATGYKTEAESGGKGGIGFDGEQPSRKPEYNWKNVGLDETESYPVVNVSWNDAIKYCEWLGTKENAKFRLPSEAEWEYACRAGSAGRYHVGNDPEELARVDNVADASTRDKLILWDGIKAGDGYANRAPVGTFQSNPWGLFDMHGNVKEWCADWYGLEYYDRSPPADPMGPSRGDFRIIRGGNCFSNQTQCRSVVRAWAVPSSCTNTLGFRIVRLLHK